MNRNRVKEIIDDWDPLELLCCAPEDEYFPEIELIQQLLKVSKDFTELSDGIYKVFENAFGENFKKSKEECEVIARLILSQK